MGDRGDGEGDREGGWVGVSGAAADWVRAVGCPVPQASRREDGLGDRKGHGGGGGREVRREESHPPT